METKWGGKKTRNVLKNEREGFDLEILIYTLTKFSVPMVSLREVLSKFLWGCDRLIQKHRVKWMDGWCNTGSKIWLDRGWCNAQRASSGDLNIAQCYENKLIRHRWLNANREKRKAINECWLSLINGIPYINQFIYINKNVVLYTFTIKLNEKT